MRLIMKKQLIILMQMKRSLPPRLFWLFISLNLYLLYEKLKPTKKRKSQPFTNALDRMVETYPEGSAVSCSTFARYILITKVQSSLIDLFGDQYLFIYLFICLIHKGFPSL